MTNHDLEASVIGGLLLGGYTTDAADVLATLPAEAFTLRLYRETYAEIKRQALNRHLIDGLMIAEAMGERNSANVIQTIAQCPSAANLRGYAAILGKYHLIREFKNLVAEGNDALNAAHNHEQALEFINTFANRVAAAAKPGGEVEPVHVDELLDSYGVMLERRLTHGEESDTLKTGIAELDDITGGMNPEDLVIVAARPGMGKTEFALKVAEGVASSHRVQGCSAAQRGVLIFSMEMSSHQVIERSLAGAAQISVSSLRKPSRMDEECWARVANGMGLLAGLDVWIVDASHLSVEQIRAIAERHKRKHPSLSLILADYLGLIKKPSAERNDLAIAHISGSLKRMAKELKTPVMCLSQLSRDVEKRPAGQRRPTNADLRDSGSIEQDADTIIMLYREAVYNANSPAAPYAEIIVTKNRFGALGTVYQQFKNGHFVETDQAEAKRICSAGASTAKPRRYAQQGEF